ncbi:MAG: endonuclease III [Kiritimatiellia bacterium]
MIKPTPALKKRAAAILKALRKLYPGAHCELIFETPLDLAVAAILSAQCTDKRVNMVTPALFKKYHTAADWARADLATLEQEIHSTGFFRNKAKNIRTLGQALCEKHKGVLPQDLETLITLPGIGRKTANVLLISAFGKPGITVDTHCTRVSRRLALTDSDNPEKIEMDLKKIFAEKDWADLSHCFVFHGRYCCFARKPQCGRCPLAEMCPSCEL